MLKELLHNISIEWKRVSLSPSDRIWLAIAVVIMIAGLVGLNYLGEMLGEAINPKQR